MNGCVPCQGYFGQSLDSDFGNHQVGTIIFDFKFIVTAMPENAK